MSVVSIPIVNRNYPMGCEDGQEGRLIELGRIVDARARQILDKIGPLQESALLAYRWASRLGNRRIHFGILQ